VAVCWHCPHPTKSQCNGVVSFSGGKRRLGGHQLQTENWKLVIL